MAPCSRTACSAYALQDGANRHRGASKGLMKRR